MIKHALHDYYLTIENVLICCLSCTYCVVGSVIAVERSSNVSIDSSIAFSYKLIELNVCTTLIVKEHK